MKVKGQSVKEAQITEKADEFCPRCLAQLALVGGKWVCQNTEGLPYNRAFTNQVGPCAVVVPTGPDGLPTREYVPEKKTSQD